MNESKNLLVIDSESLNLQTSHVFVLHFELLLNSYFLPMIRSHPYQERVARQWLCIEIAINLPKRRRSSNLDRAPVSIYKNDYFGFLFWYSLALMSIFPVSTVVFPKSEKLQLISLRSAGHQTAFMLVFLTSLYMWTRFSKDSLAFMNLLFGICYLLQRRYVSFWSCNNKSCQLKSHI